MKINEIAILVSTQNQELKKQIIDNAFSNLWVKFLKIHCLYLSKLGDVEKTHT